MDLRLVFALILTLLLSGPRAQAVQLDLFEDAPSCSGELEQNPSFDSLSHLTPRSQEIWSKILAEAGRLQVNGLLSPRGDAAKSVIGSMNGLGFLGSKAEMPEDPAHAMERLLVRLSWRIEDLGLPADQKIIPGFIFMDGMGQPRILAYGSEIPESLHFATSAEIKDLVNPATFTKAMADGFQVVQVQQPLDANFIYVQHDISHLIGLARDAGYMRSVRKMAKERAPTVGQRVNSPTNEDVAGFYVFEAISHGNGEALKRFFRELGVPQAYDCETLECVRVFLTPQVAEAQRLYRLMAYEIMIPFGGSAVGGQKSINIGSKLLTTFDPYFNYAAQGPTGRVSELVYHFLMLSKISIENHVARIGRGNDAYLCRAYRPLFNSRTPPEFIRLFCNGRQPSNFAEPDPTLLGGTCDGELTQEVVLHSLDGLSPRSRKIWTEQIQTLGQRMIEGYFRLSGSAQARFRKSLDGLGFLQANGQMPLQPTLAAERLILNLRSRAVGFDLPEGETITPGFLFIAGVKAMTIIPYGTELRDDMKPVTLDDVKQLMGALEFTRFLAKGFQVIQLPQSKTDTFVVAQHDVGHVIGQTQDKGYMRVVRKIAIDRIELFKESNMVPPPDTAGFYISEYLSHGDPAAMKEYFRRLGIPEAYECEKVTCIQGYLARLGRTAETLFNELSSQIIVPYGGAVVGGQDGNLGGRMFSQFDPYIQYRVEGAGRRLAKLVFHYMQLSKISVEAHAARIYSGGNAYLCEAYKPLFNWDTPASFKRLFCAR